MADHRPRPAKEDKVKHPVPLAAGILGGASVLLASALSSVGCSPSRPKSAEEVVKRMSDRLASAQSFSFTTQEKHQRRRGGKVVDIERSRSFTVRRPDGIAFKTVGGEMGGGSGAYDGKSLTMVWPEQKAYARVKMPATIDAAIERLEDHFAMALPVGDILASNAYDALVSAHTTGRYVGREKAGAAECDHVAFTHARVDFELWVAAGASATPCRLTITTKGPSGPLTSDVSFADWNLAAAPPADAFEAAVPPDYERLPVTAFETGEETRPAAALESPGAAPPASPKS